MLCGVISQLAAHCVVLCKYDYSVQLFSPLTIYYSFYDVMLLYCDVFVTGDIAVRCR